MEYVPEPVRFPWGKIFIALLAFLVVGLGLILGPSILMTADNHNDDDEVEFSSPEVADALASGSGAVQDAEEALEDLRIAISNDDEEIANDAGSAVNEAISSVGGLPNQIRSLGGTDLEIEVAQGILDDANEIAETAAAELLNAFGTR